MSVPVYFTILHKTMVMCLTIRRFFYKIVCKMPVNFILLYKASPYLSPSMTSCIIYSRPYCLLRKNHFQPSMWIQKRQGRSVECFFPQ